MVHLDMAFGDNGRRGRKTTVIRQGVGTVKSQSVRDHKRLYQTDPNLARRYFWQ